MTTAGSSKPDVVNGVVSVLLDVIVPPSSDTWIPQHVPLRCVKLVRTCAGPAPGRKWTLRSFGPARGTLVSWRRTTGRATSRRLQRTRTSPRSSRSAARSPTGAARRSLVNMFSSAANVAIPASALLILRLLQRRSPLTVSELADALRLHPSTVSTQLRPLTDQGYVRRAVDVSDRRVAPLSITARGRRALAKVEQIGADEWRTVLSDWSARDRHMLAELVDRARRDTEAAILESIEAAANATGDAGRALKGSASRGRS